MTFSLNVLKEEEVKAAIVEETKPIPEQLRKIQEMAEKDVADIMSLDLNSDQAFERKQKILKDINDLGSKSLEKSTEKNALLRITLGNLGKTSEGEIVGKGLGELHSQIKDLDPSLVDFTKTGFLGKFFNPVRAYFQKYVKAEDAIADIVKSLIKGRDRLNNNNITLLSAQEGLRQLLKDINMEIQYGDLMDKLIDEQINAAKGRGEDPEKIKFISEKVLYPIRQKLISLNKMRTITQQGIMAYEIAVNTNDELIRGVDEARTVTVTALRTAVTVASALYDSKIVLKKLDLLDEATNSLIENVADMLSQDAVDIHKRSLNRGVSIETLKNAIGKSMQAMEEITRFKLEALPLMKQTIEEYNLMAMEGEKVIQRIEKGHQLEI